jgi:hypothetical protein
MKAAHHTQEQSRDICLLTGYISFASESGTTSSDGDPPAADVYTEEMGRCAADCDGKGSATKWCLALRFFFS